jgi:hypothetical protein
MRQSVSMSKGGLLALVVEDAAQLLAGVEQSSTNSAVAVRIMPGARTRSAG